MDEVRSLNERLKAANCNVSVRLKGRNLALRATLPMKPGQGSGRKQQDISLRIPASTHGLKRAEHEAHGLAQALAEGSFSWAKYGFDPDDRSSMPVSTLLESFKTYYQGRNKVSEYTWKNTWLSTFKKLPQDRPLTDGMILALVLSIPADSRSRESACQRLQHLANYAGIEIDLKPYHGCYESSPRDIPSDETIEQWRDRISNPAWQWVYGAIATFGLRPHEAFKCEFLDPLTLKVFNDTKTGSRITRAIHPRWAENWNLIEVQRPNTVATSNRDLGQRVSRQFGSDRYNLPMVPYDLRHAWAIRSSVAIGLPVSTSAAMMGHSVATHTRIYHRWLSDAQNEAVYRRLVLGEKL